MAPTRTLAMLAVALLMAGCASRDATTDDPQGGAPDDPNGSATATTSGAPGGSGGQTGTGNATSIPFSKSYTLTLTQAMAAGFGYVGDNCVVFPGANIAALAGGTVNATWSSAAPLDLQLTVRLSTGEQVAAAGPGSSPLSATLPAIATEGADLQVRIAVPDDTGAGAQQTIELAIQFTYDGATALDGQIGPC